MEFDGVEEPVQLFEFPGRLGANCRDMGFPSQRPIKMNSEIAIDAILINLNFPSSFV